MTDYPAQQQTVLRTFTHAVVKTTSIIGGLYVVRGYMRERLDDVRVKMETEQRAREVLRTRFLQTQEDTSYTILALLPTLSAQVLQAMDVDAITRELQLRSRARNSGLRQQNMNANLIQAPAPHDLPLSSSSVSATTDGVLVDASSISASGVYPPNPYPSGSDDSRSDSSFAPSNSNSNSSAHSASSSYRGSPAPSASASLSLEREREGGEAREDVSASYVSDAGSVTRSWVVDASSSRASEAAFARAGSPAASSAVSSSAEADAGGVGSAVDQRMSESMVSVNTDTTRMSADSEGPRVVGVGGGLEGRSKAELWNEVKMLTMTRTLTTLYSTTLLCLLTTVQLTILARAKYVAAVRAQEKEERRRERMEGALPSVAGMVLRGVVGNIWGGKGAGDVGELERLLRTLEGGGGGEDTDEEDEEGMDRDEDGDDGWGLDWGLSSASFSSSGARRRNPKTRTHAGAAAAHPQVATNGYKDCYKNGMWTGAVSEEAESKYLTMSWWLLHVGWKDVGERVRRGVEEVFDGVSLKTKLTAADLHRLIADVRRRVECEITFEGNERRTNFLSSLLPPTPETIHHVLIQGGFSPAPAPMPVAVPLANQQDADDNNDDDPLGRHIDVDLGVETARAVGAGSRVDGARVQRNSGHERKLSDASTSIESSQLSHTFANSPAVAVSAYRPPNDVLRPTGQPQPQPQQTTPLTLHPHPGSHPQPQPTYLPPPPAPSAYAYAYAQLLDAPFLALVEETRGVLGGADFARVLEGCLDAAVGVLLEGLEGNVFARAAGEGGGADTSGEGGERVRLAGLLPGLARWSQLAMEGLPNELVDKILNMRDISCLSAIAFGRFEEQFEGI